LATPRTAHEWSPSLVGTKIIGVFVGTILTCIVEQPFMRERISIVENTFFREMHHLYFKVNICGDSLNYLNRKWYWCLHYNNLL